MGGKLSLFISLLLITVGAGWLLTILGYAPGIDWVWTLGLIVAGVAIFAVGGIDKITIVVGTFFVVASLMSVLRQTNRLRLDVEVPILVIVFGVLLLIARLSVIPMPKWLIDESDKEESPTNQ